MTDRTPALAKLREPFETIERVKKEWTDKKTGEKKSVTLDYVGHAFVTDRLLDADPEWTWEPLALTPDGRPLLDLNENGRPVGLWIKLTVAGVTRLGYGTVEASKTEPVKELIGDAIRNAAMRFGVALDLWKKHTDSEQSQTQSRGRQATQAGSSSDGRTVTQPQIGKIAVLCKEKQIGEGFRDVLIEKKWPDSKGHLGKLSTKQASEFIDFLSSATQDHIDDLAIKYMGGESPKEPAA